VITTSEDQILKLHADRDGAVWFLDGKRSPTCSGEAVDTFLDMRLIQGRTIRLLGTQENAALATALYHAKVDGVVANVQLAGPLVCATQAERGDPARTLWRMRQCRLPGSLGGWHTMRHAEFATYALIRQLRVDGCVTEAVYNWLRSHPVYRSLRFIGTLHEQNLAILLATLVDPRFYVDLRKPDRSSKWFAFLGLTPRTQTAVDKPHQAAVWDQYRHRCKLTKACWHPGGSDLQVSASLRTLATLCETGPRHFLWRIWKAQDDKSRATLRASQAFATFLRYVWLDAVTPYAAAGGERLFSPELFFAGRAGEDELEAYREFVRRNDENW